MLTTRALRANGKLVFEADLFPVMPEVDLCPFICVVNECVERDELGATVHYNHVRC